MSEESAKNPRPIAEDNPNTISVLVRITPALRDSLDAWLGEVNTHVIGPRWSRTDLLREALAHVARTRPKLGVPVVSESPVPASRPVPPVPVVKETATKRVETPEESERDSRWTPAAEKALRKRCKTLRLSGTEIAELIGVGQTTASRWLRTDGSYWCEREPERLDRLEAVVIERESTRV